MKNKLIVLTTTKSAGAALDIKGLKVTVILAEVFKSEVMARQALGRTRDYDTHCIECLDLGFSATEACYNNKRPTLEYYALDIEEIYLDDAMIDARIYEIMKSEEERVKTIYSNEDNTAIVDIIDDENERNKILKDIKG